MWNVPPELCEMVLERLDPNSLSEAARVRKDWRSYIGQNVHKMRSITQEALMLTLTNDVEALLISDPKKYADPIYMKKASIPFKHIERIYKYRVNLLAFGIKSSWPINEKGFQELNNYLPEWWIKGIKTLVINFYHREDYALVQISKITSRFGHLEDFFYHMLDNAPMEIIIDGISAGATRIGPLMSRLVLEDEFFRRLSEESNNQPIKMPELVGTGVIISLQQLIDFIKKTNFANDHWQSLMIDQLIGNIEDWYDWVSINTTRLTEQEIRSYFERILETNFTQYDYLAERFQSNRPPFKYNGRTFDIAVRSSQVL